MDLKKVIQCVEQREYLLAMEEIDSILVHMKSKNSHQAVKRQLGLLNECEIGYLRKLFGRVFMTRYASFLARYAHRRFNTITTLHWYCEDLFYSGRVLEAEEHVRDAIEKVKMKDKQLEDFTNLLFRILIDLHQNEEAFKLIDSLKNRPLANRRMGQYYENMGNLKKAKSYYQEGLKEESDAYIYQISLIHVSKMMGDFQEAERFINEGLVKYPEIPIFFLEEVYFKMNQKQYEDIPELVKHFHERLPHHEMKMGLNELVMESYYYQNKIDVLNAFLESNPVLQSLTIGKLVEGRDGEVKRIPLKSVIQKRDYCVPATLEMMIERLNMSISQDEIAASIFEGRGSSLLKAVHYLEDLGFCARWFVGNVSLYKALLDKNIPILVSIDYEYSAHVQIICGYDDRIEAFIIQDSNTYDPFLLSYQTFEDYYFNSGFQSIVFVNKEDEFLLHEIPSGDTDYFKVLFTKFQKYNQDLLDYLKHTENYLFSKLAIIKHAYQDFDKDYVRLLAEDLLQAYSNSDYIKLQVANCYYFLDLEDEAIGLLKQLKTKNYHSSYHLLCGKIAQFQERDGDMLKHYRKAVQLDPDEAILWSYLALAYLYNDKFEQALRASTYAIHYTEDHSIILHNHGRILLAHNRYQEARDWLTKALKINKKHPALWYERARCDEYLGRTHQAIRGYHVSRKLDPDVLAPYMAIAELYQEDETKYETFLLEAITLLPNTAEIVMLLAQFYFTMKKDYALAKKYYEQAVLIEAHFEHELGIAYCIEKLEGINAYEQYIVALYERYHQQPSFLRVIGKNEIMDGHVYNKKETMNRGFRYLEECIQLSIEPQLDDLIFYVELIGETKEWKQGIAFLKNLSSKYELNGDVYSSLGFLYEERNQFEKALEYYEKGLELSKTFFVLYRSGQVYSQHSQKSEAVAYFNACLELQPSHTGALYGLVINEEEKDKRYRAIKHLLEVDPLVVMPEELAYYGRQSNLVKELISLLELMEGRILETWRLDTLGYLFGEDNEFVKEEEYVKKALMIRREKMVVYHLIEIYLKKEAFTLALEELEELILEEIDNEYVGDLWLIAVGSYQNAVLYIKQFSDDEDRSHMFIFLANALTRYFANQEERNELSVFSKFLNDSLQVKKVHIKKSIQEAYKYNSLNVDANYYIIDELLRAFKYKEAEKLIRNYLDKRFEPVIALNLGHIIGLNPPFATSDMEEMEQLMPLVLNENRNDLDALRILGHVKMVLGKYEEAKALLQRNLEIGPGLDAHVYVLLGDVYRKMEDFESSIRISKRGLHHFPNHSILYENVAFGYSNQNNFSLAIYYCTQAIQFDESTLRNYYNRACYYTMNNQIDLALKDLEYVLKTEKDNTYYHLALEDPELEAIRVRMPLKKLKKKWWSLV